MKAFAEGEYLGAKKGRVLVSKLIWRGFTEIRMGLHGTGGDVRMTGEERIADQIRESVKGFTESRADRVGIEW